jgi:hypothetical protein
MDEERGEVNTGVWSGNPRERDYLEDTCIDGMRLLK